ncbi:putative metalloprotease CJM1_0395 family protein [Rheinheimera sp. 1928-s]|uniref:putative metalloprotease CJM1_0395 family protein n=1 Tax=Rheinheimera sp. 1928-s TaxID=3033803 RepID=UPI00262076A5|nr:putative metalloprotease CJM1_0395 family protein [Rheinheimera sp. 1928-s]MDF3126929.1 putative metalloprotease CJM1_0395 family protein [Rheinheimera sp. 1928-s]
MLLTSNYPNVPLHTGNPAMDMARRDNLRREVIEPVAAMERSAAEKGLMADEKSRNGNASTYEDVKTKGLEYRQAVVEKESQSDSEQDKQNSSGQQKDDPQQQKEEQAEQKRIAELKARDREVKIHEQAHAAIGGQYASAPSYEYETGPDGQQYAVGGEVRIDISEIPNDPRATIQKMQQVKAAALAPAEPSGADRSVAAQASRTLMEAQADLTAEIAEMVRSRSEQTSQTSVLSGGEWEPYEALANNEANDFAVPQFESLQRDPLMTLRSDVISGFYAKATTPAERPLLQMA